MRQNQVISLMITDGEKWHYLAVKSLPELLRGITSNYNGDLYCLGCLYSFRTDNKLKKHEKLCNNDDYCYVEMPSEYNKILKYNHGEKSLKSPFTTYLDLECLLKKEQSCQNSPEKSYTEKKPKHKPSGWAMFTKWSFDEAESKFDYYRGIDCIKKWCEKLRNRATEIINYQEKSKKIATYAKKNFVMIKMRKISLNYTKKSEIIVILQENLEDLHIVFPI